MLVFFGPASLHNNRLCLWRVEALSLHTKHPCLRHMRCSAKSCHAKVSAAVQKQEGAIEEEIFENERYLPIRGWASRGGLLPTERRRYSTRDGSQSFNDFPTLHLPTGKMLQRSAYTCGAPWHPA